MSAGFALEGWQVRLVLPHRPPVLQLDRAECAAGLGDLRAEKLVGGGDPMVYRSKASRQGRSFLAPGLLIEALAQCCGLLLRLRWLDQQGADLAAFAAGDPGAIEHHDIPRSVLADSHARFRGQAPPATTVRLETALVLSRGEIHRFRATAAGIASAEISLKFPHAD